MKPIWLIGEHVEHSPSAVMQNAAFAAMDLEPCYALRPCPPDALELALSQAEQTCRGINVTAPYKLAVAQRYAAVLDDNARLAGAVNTVVYEHGAAVRALNTDVAGLLSAWRRAAIDVEDRTAAVVGAGGAARAVVVALKEAGARGVVVHARSARRAAGLLSVAQAAGLEAVIAEEPCGARLLVLAASELEDAGSWMDRGLAAAGAVHDLRYGLRARPARDAALQRGHLFLDGTTMLLAQGLRAFEAFLGNTVPPEVEAAMRAALVEALRFVPG